MVELAPQPDAQEEAGAPREQNMVPDDPLAKDLWGFATKKMKQGMQARLKLILTFLSET